MDGKLFASDREIAKMLGHKVDWLTANARTLETTSGFPKVDPLVGLRHVESVIEWARNRNLTQVLRHQKKVARSKNVENLDAI